MLPKIGFLGWDVIDEGKIEEESDIDDTKKKRTIYPLENYQITCQ